MHNLTSGVRLFGHSWMVTA